MVGDVVGGYDSNHVIENVKYVNMKTVLQWGVTV